MSLDFGQQVRMSLGGTQALPVPGPALGNIRWAASRKNNADRLVEVTFERSPNHAIIWLVRVDDLMAIEEKSKLDAKKKKIEWYVGPEVCEALDASKEGMTGIAYVREEAQTLLRLEHGVSVINSVHIVAGEAPLAADADFEIHSGCNPC